MENDNIQELPPSFDDNGEVNDTFKNIHIVKMDEVDPLNDPECKHEFVKDPTDENENYYAEVCKNCPVGRLIRKL